MIVELAKAKVNLALHVLGRRADGYHMLDSIVGFADIGDVLSFTAAPATGMTLKGPFAPMLTSGDENIVMKTVRAMYNHFGDQLPSGVAIELDKRVPIASGIGGGSADAAATLRGLNRLWNLKLDASEQHRLALGLGADVPACLQQSYCRMRGIGEKIDVLGKPPAPAIVLVNPRVSQLTQSVFAELGLDLAQRYRSGVEIDKPGHWRNDLQAPAIRMLPSIEKVLAMLREIAPGNTVRMSGSGATCFALCENVASAESLAAKVNSLQPSWWVVASTLG